MIVEWLLSLVAGVSEFFAALLPDWQVPDELTSPGGIVSQVIGYGSALGIFIDWPFVIAVGLIPLGVWASGILFRVAKTAATHIPFFGGH